MSGLEKLHQIDRSVLEKLTRIRAEQKLVQDYLGKADQLKDKVDAIVFERVLEDYKCRHAALEEKARPLENDARQEYRRLHSLQQEMGSACEEARLEKEELEFRRSVGELSEEQVNKRLKEAEARLEQRQSELAEADRLEAAFVKAFGSKEALEKELEKHPAGPAAPPPTVLMEASAPSAKAEPASISSPDETIIVPSTMLETSKAKKNKTPGSDAGKPASHFDETIIVPDAMLVTEAKAGPRAEYRLGALNYIGRNEENHIRLKGRGVSRKHALVMAGPEGFILRDLKSRCGTFVNKKRVEECRLNDGDRVRFGEVQLVFRLT